MNGSRVGPDVRIISAPVRRTPWLFVVTAAIVGLAGPVGPAYADHMVACASLRVKAECGGECEEREGEACFITPSIGCLTGCYVTPVITFEADECSSIADILLHIADPEDPCGNLDDTDPDFPMPLTSGTDIWLTKARFDNLMTLVYMVEADPSAEGEASIYGNPEKVVMGIPTLSEWGVVAMVGLLLTAGTVVFGRRRPRAA